MAITNLLAPIPKWVIINNQGLPAGGAKLYTKRSLNKVEDKAVYQDAAGAIPYANPIIFDANGTEGPFYWQVDSANLTDTYYLEAYDSADNLLWTMDGFAPPGEGGGGSTTTYANLNNFIANHVFLDHIANTANPIGVVNLALCPSNHRGFTPDQINPVIGTFGAVGPDIRFVKNNTNATDQITFEPFVLGSDPLTGDVTPVEYLRYQCTNSPAGETYKAFQFPINQKVNSLDNQTMTFTIWARVAATPVSVVVYSRQYFGSGGSPSAEVRTSLGTLALTTSWQKLTVNLTIPNTSGKTLGSCGDDALYIHLEMPLGAPCDVWFTKPSLYLGAINPTAEFDTYDQIDRITQSPRTGEIQMSMRPSAPYGWVRMDNQSIGSATSGATNRANQDTFPLYKTLWDAISDTYAPVSTGRGASAVADFAANKTLTLTRSLGRVLAGANPNFNSALTFTADSTTERLTVSSTSTLPTGTPVLVSNSGGALPSPLAANTVYYAINVSGTTLSLATSVDNAEAGTAINLTNNGSGTNSLLPALGVFNGEGEHTQTLSELVAHTHTVTFNRGQNHSAPLSNNPTTNDIIDGTISTTSSSTGGGSAFNVMQPTLFSNIFIKL